MELTQADINEFKKLYAKHFGEHLDDIVAREKLSLLVRQMAVVYQPITKQQMESLQRITAERSSNERQQNLH